MDNGVGSQFCDHHRGVGPQLVVRPTLQALKGKVWRLTRGRKGNLWPKVLWDDFLPQVRRPPFCHKIG